ncbi:hypothetical protein BKA01_007554 [Pseudonocardia eucalypti]|nr:hypothetical protein [Pseudonocardia eucalypti]
MKRVALVLGLVAAVVLARRLAARSNTQVHRINTRERTTP